MNHYIQSSNHCHVLLLLLLNLLLQPGAAISQGLDPFFHVELLRAGRTAIFVVAVVAAAAAAAAVVVVVVVAGSRVSTSVKRSQDRT